MRTGIVVEVTVAERDRLEAIVADRNSPQKHVWRAGIVLATADGLGTVAIMRHTAKSKTVVWRWQERFAQEGVDGLLRDKTRPSRVKPFGPEVAERIVALTLAEPPGETTHWTGRAMAKVAGVSLSYRHESSKIKQRRCATIRVGSKLCSVGNEWLRDSEGR
jgi:transposase